MSEKAKIEFPMTMVLPVSGKTAVIKSFKGRDAMDAQREAGTEGERYLPALIARTTTIDGEPIVVADLEEMDGPDYMALMAKFSNVFI